MKFIDFFAGVGGFRHGLELAGHKCVGFCEWDKFAAASYTSMHLITDEQRKYLSSLTLKQRQKEILKNEYRNGEWYANDIRNVDAGSLPAADCWCFGAPCQDFSIAGKRAGLDGDRSSLIREIFRLLEEQEEQDRPEWLIYENVKGMLSSNRGLDYLSILSEMDRLGYDIEWQNINSKWFVPQNRERIYTIGHLRRFGSRKVFPITGADGENSVSIIGTTHPNRHSTGDIHNVDGIMSTCTSRDYKQPKQIGIKIIGEINSSQDGQVHDISGISKCHSVGNNNSPKIAIPCDVKCININNENGEERPQQDRVYDVSGIMTALNSQLGGRHNIAIPVLTPDRVEKRQNGRRFKENGEPMFTLTAQDRHGVGIGVRYTENGFHLYRKDKKKSTIQGTHVTYQNGNVQCLGTTHVPMTMEKIGIIDPQGRNKKEVSPKDIRPTLRSEKHGNLPNVCVNIHETSNYGNGIYVEMPEGFIVYAIWYEKEHCYITIRKFTPKECFRLQGWTDDYFEKAAFINSDSQLYKQAGNQVTVDVVKAIGDKIKEYEKQRIPHNPRHETTEQAGHRHKEQTRFGI